MYSMTDKLTFAENPVLEIKGQLFEVQADAETILLIMGDFEEKSEMSAALSAYERLFSEESRKRLMELKLNSKDFMQVIQTAMLLAQGEDPDKQEEPNETPSVLQLNR